MELIEFCSYLNQLLPAEKIIDFAPNGLQVEGKKTIKNVSTAVSANLETIQKAIERGVDALIVHHGLFWQKDSYVVSGIKKEKLFNLMEHGISLLAYHLPLDIHKELGNNWRAAIEMGWENLEPFCYVNGSFLGVKGTIRPTLQKDFQKNLESYYSHEAICAWGGPETIKTIGLVSGGGYKYLNDAVQDKLDAFITGNYDEPAWHQAIEEKVNFLALGHSATERVGPRALAEHIEKQLSIPCSFIDVKNPF